MTLTGTVVDCIVANNLCVSMTFSSDVNRASINGNSMTGLIHCAGTISNSVINGNVALSGTTCVATTNNL